MDTERIEVMNEIKTLCRKVRMMRADIAYSIGVSERTLIRWLNGKTVIDVIHYKRLLNLANNEGLAMHCVQQGFFVFYSMTDLSVTKRKYVELLVVL